MYYVIYWNQQDRHVSCGMYSIDDCNDFIKGAKETDLRYGMSFKYFITKKVEVEHK